MKNLRSHVFCVIFPAMAFALLAPAVKAGSYTFQTLNNSGDPAFNQLLGINNAGTIAGYFGDGSSVPNKGYTLVPPSSYTNENFPGSVQTQVVGINNAGPPANTVGFYIDGSGNNIGFVDQGGSFSSVNDPSTASFNGITTNQLLGVNDGGVAAGFYLDSSGAAHGYLYNISSASFTAVTFPGATSTTATGINNAGVISGFYTDAGGVVHGFIDNGGTYTSFDDPSGGGTNTMLLGLNNEGLAVGSFVDGSGETQGLILNIGTVAWQTISDPGASATAAFNVTGTTVNGLNDAGDLVGFYSDGTNVDGFLATPIATPEPGTFGLISLGGVLVWMARARNGSGRKLRSDRTL